MLIAATERLRGAWTECWALGRSWALVTVKSELRTGRLMLLPLTLQTWYKDAGDVGSLPLHGRDWFGKSNLFIRFKMQQNVPQGGVV